MQLEVFKYFKTLAETGSFYRASKELFISPQGLNKSISSLEEELGVQLIERSRTGVTLTQKGEIFLAYAHQMMQLYYGLVDEMVLSPDAHNTSPLHVHVSYYMLQILAGLQRRITSIDEVVISEIPFNNALQMAEHSDGSELFLIDAHPQGLALIRQNKQLRFEPLLYTQFGFVLHENNPYDFNGPLHRSTVQKLPLAYNSFRDMEKITQWIFRDHPLHEVRLRVTSPRILLEFVQSSTEAVATFDSFGFYMSQGDAGMPTDYLEFWPLATPDGACYVGFLYNTAKTPSIRARRLADQLSQTFQLAFPKYYKKYPLSTYKQ